MIAYRVLRTSTPTEEATHFQFTFSGDAFSQLFRTPIHPIVDIATIRNNLDTDFARITYLHEEELPCINLQRMS